MKVSAIKRQLVLSIEKLLRRMVYRAADYPL